MGDRGRTWLPSASVQSAASTAGGLTGRLSESPECAASTFGYRRAVLTGLCQVALAA